MNVLEEKVEIPDLPLKRAAYLHNLASQLNLAIEVPFPYPLTHA